MDHGGMDHGGGMMMSDADPTALDTLSGAKFDGSGSA